MQSLQNFDRDFVFNFKESFDLQLEAMDAAAMTPLQQRYFLRNLLIALELHFASRDTSAEIDGGSLQELRDAAQLMLHDAKAEVARAYLEELAEGVFAEILNGFSA